LQGIAVLRMLIILGEIGVFFLLKKLFHVFSIPSSQLIFYWLNPLVILELTGNLHFEGFVLLSLLLAVYLIWQSRFAGAGFFWGIAIGIKLLPFMLVPAILAFAKTRKTIGFWIASFVAILISFSWLMIGDSWMNFFQSLRLYQGKFEFNASIYYLLRIVGFWLKGYNTIATLSKILSGVTLVSILFFAWKRKPKSIPELVDLWVLIYLIYLVLQPVVHPWYILPALGLSLLTERKVFLIWSFAAVFSYQVYGNANYREQSLFLFLEYGLVCVGIYLDYFRQKRNSNLQL
jgi:alpha-1,6-mannosyltransferase